MQTPYPAPGRGAGGVGVALSLSGWDPFSTKWHPFSAEQFIIARFVGRTCKKESSYVKQETIPSRTSDLP